MDHDEIGLEWTGGIASVSRIGAMLRFAEFRDAGRRFSPFARAGWQVNDPDLAHLPIHLRALGGEFVALPFGSAPLPEQRSEEWANLDAPAQDPPHGAAANGEWNVVRRTKSSVTLSLELPEPSAIARIERTIEGRAGSPALDFELSVTSRRDHRAPIGLHPIFRLPDEPRSLGVQVEFSEGVTYPGDIDGGSKLILPGTQFSALHSVPGVAGSVNLSAVPLDRPAEEVVQLLGARSPVRVRWPGGETIELRWDDRELPSLLVWLSDRQLAGHPFSGRYRGLGLEPIASAFDLPPQISNGPNPIAASGTKTNVTFRANRTWRTVYSIKSSFV